jgi:hypothetical protein
MKFSHALITAVMTAAFGSFLYWYGGSGEPLTAAEREEILSYARRQNASSYLYEFVESVTELDDGKEAFFVNLIKYREKAEYPGGNGEYGDDAAEANRRYLEIMALQLAKRACHPVFISRALTFLKMGNVSPVLYDEVAIVRYRSIRDFASIYREVKDMDGTKHKVASVLQSEIHVVKANFVFPFVKVIVGSVLFGLGYYLCSFF